MYVCNLGYIRVHVGYVFYSRLTVVLYTFVSVTTVHTFRKRMVDACRPDSFRFMTIEEMTLL